MEDKSLFSNNQPQTISEGLQNFIDAMVEEIVLEGKPFDTQKKYLKKFSENEGLDYETIESSITELIETLGEMKSSDSKSLMKLALIQAKEACVTEAEVLKIVEQMGEKEGEAQSAPKVALGGIIQNLQNHSESVTHKMNGSNIDFNVNGVEFKMMKVEGGTFWMGAHNQYRKKGLFSKEPDTSIPNFDEEAKAYESPVHIVTLSSFYMAETVVTQALWETVMGNNPSTFKGDSLPVEYVNYDDCKRFLKKLNQLTGKNFCFPTEAEWEFAARGGNLSRGYKYAGSNDIDKVAWYGGNSENKLHAVKLKSPNELGLYDMSGNIDEWCMDWYGDYVSGPCNNPQGPNRGSYRVLRGGNWFYPWASKHRVTDRRGESPINRGFRDVGYGFRLALSE